MKMPRTPIQLELPLIIKGDNLGEKKKDYKFYGFKTRQEFIDACLFDREWKVLCKQRGISCN